MLSWSWSTFSRSRTLKCAYLENLRASKKMLRYNFVEVVICHRIGPLWMLYSMTLTLIIKVKHVLLCIDYKNAEAVDVSGRFASTCMALVVELLLLIFLARSQPAVAKQALMWSSLLSCRESDHCWLPSGGICDLFERCKNWWKRSLHYRH